jgi:hypothetical protein
MASTRLATFRFVHNSFAGGSRDLSLPANTSIATLTGLFRDLTGLDVSGSQVQLKLHAIVTRTASLVESAEQILLDAPDHRIEIELVSPLPRNNLLVANGSPQSQLATIPAAAPAVSGQRRTRAQAGIAATTSPTAPPPASRRSSTANTAASAPEQPPAAFTIDLFTVVECTSYRVLESTPFSKIMNAFEVKNGFPAGSCRFMYDAARIAPSDTPGTLGLSEGERVAVFPAQLGD